MSQGANNQDLQVQILTYDRLEKKIVEYVIRVKQGENSWIMRARYSTLFEIHLNLTRFNDTALPRFPKRTLFRSIKERFLNQRKAALEFYITTLLRYQNEDRVSYQ